MSEQIVYFSGKFLPESEAKIPILTHALHYGTGVFEGLRAYFDERTEDMLLFRAQDHFERMAQSVKILNIRLPLAPPELTRLAAELIRLNDLATDLYIRPIAFKSATRVGVSLPQEDAFAMIALPMGSYLDTHKGLHCGVSSWRRPQDNSIPGRAKICGAYVNAALAAQEARERGLDEAIVLTEGGHVAEGSAMNIFLVREGRLVTPDISAGILEGITRDSVMTIARESLGVAVDVRVVERSELYIADEVFLCGTAAQIAPVTRIDGRAVGTGEIGDLTLDLQSQYNRAVRGRVLGHRRWVEPVYGYSHGPQKISA